MPKPIVQEIRAIDKTKGAFNSVNRSLSKFKVALGALAIGGLTKGFVDVARQASVLQASLKTATGSATGAALAFEALSKFAKETPFALDQSINAFIKLKNLGLDPSIDALTSYGNTAAATGKDLNQFIEAVADAATNEFERLKEFGIKAKQQGDQVAFTFRGVTTTVQKEAGEIEKYLRKIGDTEFAGALEERSKTLDGALSNLGDSFTGLVNRIASSGVSAALVQVANSITAIVDVAADGITALRGLFKLSENANDIKLVTSRLGNLRAELKDLNEDIEREQSRPEGAINASYLRALKQRQAEALGEFSFLESKQKRLQQLASEFKLGGDSPQITAPPPVTGGRGGETEAQRRAKRIKEYIADLQKEAETLGFNSEQLAAYELRALGASQAQIDLGVALQSTATDFEKQQKALEATAAAQEELENFADSLTRAVNPAQEVADQLVRIEEAFAAGLISADTYFEGTIQAMDRMKDGLDEVDEKIEKTKTLGEELGPVMADAFGDAIVEGGKFSDILKGLEKDLLRVLTRSLITRPLTDALGGFLGGFGFPSFRAVGGPVSAGQPVVVGENGPELYVPRFNGSINTNTPGATINVIVQGVQDAASFARNQAQVARAAGQALRQAQAAV